MDGQTDAVKSVRQGREESIDRQMRGLKKALTVAK